MLADLIRVADQLLVEIRAGYQHSSQTVNRVAADLLQSGITTAQTINLLLENGFFIDAEARWRALHELACVSRVIATDFNPPEIAKRFVVNGRRLHEDHVAYSEPWASGTRFYTWNYEWLRESHPLTDKKGKPIRLSQKWLFDQAAFESAPFAEWIRPSHGPVHLNSETVTRGTEQDGPAPAGYDATVVSQVAWQTAASTYELVSHVLMLASMQAIDEVRAIAWQDLCLLYTSDAADE